MVVNPTSSRPTASSTGAVAAETAAASPAGAAPVAQTPIDWSRLAKRSLRGRYVTTLAVAGVAASAGAGIAWFQSKQQYKSEGMVRIASALPAVIKPTDQNAPIPMFDSFIQAQQELITSRTVLEPAMDQQIWSTPALADFRPTLEELAAGLKVDVKARSENLRISFISENPVVASAAVNSTIAAYHDVYTQELRRREQQRLQLLEDYRHSLATQIEQSRGLTANAPVSLAMATSAPSATMPATQPAVAMQSVSAEEAPAPPSQPAPVEITADELAITDSTMRRLNDERIRAADEVERASLTFGARHPVMIRLKLALDQVSQRADQRLRDYNVQQTAIARAAAVAAANARAVAIAAQQAASAAAASAPMPAPAPVPVAIALPPLSPAMQQVQNEFDDVTRRIEVLKTEAAMPKRFEVVSNGDFPVVVPDRRLKATAAGGVLGGSLAAVAMVIAGLCRRRYRYCAEVVEDLAGRCRFVAAIPQVSPTSVDRWADAAQCVHQLRQAFSRGAQVQLITSAGWAEGRSSVAMSLALSLSASGTRTLLIDADLATRGLTRSLHLDAQQGLHEVLSGASLQSCLLQASDGLTILPVGQSVAADGALIAASAMERLFTQLRSEFDVVLIDGGPMLSCVETSLMAKHADGVLLVVGREQQQSLVRQALAELAACEAKLNGTVFNSALPGDFDRAVHRRGPAVNAFAPAYESPAALGTFGPLVHAVATSMKVAFELRPAPAVAPPAAAATPAHSLFIGSSTWDHRNAV